MTDRSPPDPEAQTGPSVAPHETEEPGLHEEEQPNTTGTLFIMILFLMALAGMWALMYMVLLER